MEIKINAEYEKLLPKLTGEEYEALKASLARDGQLYPIIVNKKGVILDGHNRYHALMDLSKDIKMDIKDFDDPLEEKRFVIEVNLKRRHLTLFQKAELGMALMDVEKAMAKARSKAGTPTPIGVRDGEVSEIIAEKVGMGQGTFDRAKAVMDMASEKAKEKLRHDDWSINYAHEGYKAIDEVDDKEKKKELKKAFEEDKISTPQLIDMKNKTNLAKELIESRAPADQKKAISAKYEEKFYTPELDIRELEKELSAAGGIVDLKEVEVSKDLIKTKTEAEAYFKKHKGFLEGETCYWKGKVDPTTGE